MRNLLVSLSFVATALVVLFFLLPVIGVILLVVVGVLALAVGAIVLAPLLAKLPWFRDRITVDRAGGRRFVRFGRGFHTTYQNPAAGSYEQESRRPADEDVIDVSGRELPEKHD